MANIFKRFNPELSWKSWTAVALFGAGLMGMMSGVEVSERPGLPEEDVLTKAYYTLGLFVLGGMDLGTPMNGPFPGRALLWLAYFGSPVWTAWAVFETILYALRPPVWHMRKIRKRIVILGGGELALGFLNRIAASDNPRRVLIIVNDPRQALIEELRSRRRVDVVVAPSSQIYRMPRYPFHKAYRILLLSENDDVNLEAASVLLERHSELGEKVVFHVSNLRLLRVLRNSNVVQKCTSFNRYELAATQLARGQLVQRFNATAHRDTVVLAGFGRFAQSILEQLEKHASGAFSQVAIIDLHAEQRALIADEEVLVERDYNRHTYQGDIDHPEVWQRLFNEVVIGDEEPVFVIATGEDETNLRCAIWLRQKFSNALIISRTLAPSSFAKAVCAENDIVSVNTTELVESSIPHVWYR